MHFGGQLLIFSSIMSSAKPDKIEIIRPDDFHLHLRDADALRAIIGHSANHFARAIVMPNLREPVTTTDKAISYKKRILEQIPEGVRFEPLMTLYLTDNTSAAEIKKARDSGVVFGIKLYPQGATTNSDEGVSDLSKCMKALEAIERHGLPLLVHGEVVDPAVDVFDREKRFIDDVLIPLRRSMPGLRIVFEHLTTREAVQYVLADDGPVAATITAHHLLFSRNALFAGGLNPHNYCLPILKTEEDRQELVKAATSGDARFFLGTDSAPHPRHLKERAFGNAGVYTAPHALSLYARVFDEAGALDRLEAFSSVNGALFYGLEPVTDKITLIRRPWQVPAEFEFGDDVLIPFMAGQMLEWQIQQGN